MLVADDEALNRNIASGFLRLAGTILGRADTPPAHAVLPHAGLYWPGDAATGIAELRARWRADAPVAAIIFYRALFQAANLAPIDALIAALTARGLNPLPIWAYLIM